MITAVTEKTFSFRGLSTDIKPKEWNGIKVGNGSKFIEIDTSKVFLFDATTSNPHWVEYSSGGGGDIPIEVIYDGGDMDADSSHTEE